jgi:hypothetical protein
VRHYRKIARNPEPRESIPHSLRFPLPTCHLAISHFHSHFPTKILKTFFITTCSAHLTFIVLLVLITLDPP